MQADDITYRHGHMDSKNEMTHILELLEKHPSKRSHPIKPIKSHLSPSTLATYLYGLIGRTSAIAIASAPTRALPNFCIGNYYFLIKREAGVVLEEPPNQLRLLPWSPH